LRHIRAIARAALLVAALLASEWGNTAEPVTDSGPNRDSRHFEMTPFIGLRMGGSFESDTGRRIDVNDHGSFGLALGVPAGNDTQYEVFYGRQSAAMQGASSLAPSRVAVEYLHFGGTAPLDDELAIKPYVFGGLGVTRFSPVSREGRENTHFSLSLGPGLRVPLNPHFALRLEARGYVTFVNPDTALFCRSDQTGLLCRVRSRGSAFIQYELLAGAAFTF
jgi:hypothetical protein